MRTLTLTSGPAAGQEFEIDRELVVGRENADVVIADEQISRRHVALRPVEHGVEVEDLGSLNGTFLDGERIEAAVTIAIRGSITLGTSELRVDVALPQTADLGAVTRLSPDALGVTVQGRVPVATVATTEPSLPAGAGEPPLPVLSTPAAGGRSARRTPRVSVAGVAVVVVFAIAVALVLIFD